MSYVEYTGGVELGDPDASASYGILAGDAVEAAKQTLTAKALRWALQTQNLNRRGRRHGRRSTAAPWGGERMAAARNVEPPPPPPPVPVVDKAAAINDAGDLHLVNDNGDVLGRS